MDRIQMKGIMEKGYGMISKMVMQDRNLDIEAKAVYAYFTSYAGAGYSAFPGIEKILFDLSISKNRFYKYRKQLVNRGYISIQKRRKGNELGKEVWDSNIYILNTEVPERLQIEDTQNEDTQNEDTQNEDTNSNSTNSNSTNSNSTNSNSTNSKEIVSIYSYYEKVLGNLIGVREKEILDSYIEDGMSEEVIKYAIDQAVASRDIKKKNINYIKGILNRLLKEEKKEISQIETDREENRGESNGMYDFSRKQNKCNDKEESQYDQGEAVDF